MGQLHLNSSMNELRYLASRTFFNDSPFASLITVFINVFPFGCSSLFTGERILYCSNLSNSLLTLSCKWIGTLLALCFFKTASGFKGRCSGEFTFPTSNLDVAYFNSLSSNCSNFFFVIWECLKLNIVKNFCCYSVYLIFEMLVWNRVFSWNSLCFAFRCLLYYLLIIVHQELLIDTYLIVVRYFFYYIRYFLTGRNCRVCFIIT